MNPFKRIMSAVGIAQDTPLREAAGTTIDAGEEGWRRLTGDGKRDLAPMTHARMQRLAHYLWESNLLANRLIELPVAYLLSQGVKLAIEDEDAQAALDRHWKDGLNAWPTKLPKRVRELALFGEQCYPVFRDAASGFVRVGYLDPAEIETVVVDPDNREQPIGIVTRRDRHGRARRYRVIVNVPETAFGAAAQRIRAGFDSGDAFFFRVNDLSSATRGRSDLLAQMDWLDAYDVFLFGEVDRAAALRAYFFDVTLTGATPEEVKERARSIAPPRPGSVRVHNEAETWKAEAPELNAFDAGEAARLIRNHMLGGATLPEHWFGGGDSVNKSMGASMTEPTEKMLDMRQQVVGHMLATIGEYVVRSRWQALDAELSEPQAAILDTLRVEWPELTAKDTSKYAAALQQVTAASAQLMADGVLSRETALRIVASMTTRLGVEFDIHDELAAASAELAARGGAVLEGYPLTATPVTPVSAVDE